VFGRGQARTDFASTYNAQGGPQIYAHSWEEITGMCAGLELVPPGIVEASAWQPGQPDSVLEDRSSMIVAMVGGKP
jgi:S-adenosyl methyltransferase